MNERQDSRHDVFISYASEDKNTADAVCHALEDEGIRCWIAPRDVRPGQDWKPAIVSAIEDCEVMVFVFSSKSNSSTQVQTEVELAFESGHPIVPFRIEDEEMDDSLKYCVGSRHWLDAISGPIEDHIEELSASVQNILDGREDYSDSRAELPPKKSREDPSIKKEMNTKESSDSPIHVVDKVMYSGFSVLPLIFIAFLLEKNTGLGEYNILSVFFLLWFVILAYIWVYRGTVG